MLKGWPPAVAAAAIRRLRNSSFSLRSGQRRAGGVRAGTGGGKLGYTPSLALGCGHWAVPDSMAAHGDPPFVITK